MWQISHFPLTLLSHRGHLVGNFVVILTNFVPFCTVANPIAGALQPLKEACIHPGLLVECSQHAAKRVSAQIRSRLQGTYKVVNTKRVCRMRLKTVVPCTRVSMWDRQKIPHRHDRLTVTCSGLHISGKILEDYDAM
jgi:hypothetical protein